MRTIPIASSFVAAASVLVSLAALTGCSYDPQSTDKVSVEPSSATLATLATGDGGVDRGECTPGAVQTDTCPRCGTRTRTCNGDGSHGDWSRCENKKDCDLGDVLAYTCDDGTVSERRCTSTCSWGPPEACAPPETTPPATPTTGLVLAPGVAERIGMRVRLSP